MSLSSEICTYLYEAARSHNGKNIMADFNGVSVLIVQRYDDADHILRLSPAKYRKNMAWFRQTLGASRFSEEGHAWEIRRKLTQSYFNKFDRENAFTLATRYANETISRLLQQTKSKTIDDNILRIMTANVLVDNFFGIKLDETQIDMETLAQLMKVGSDYSFVPMGKTNELYRQNLAQLPDLRRQILSQLSYFRQDGVHQSPFLQELLAADQRTEDHILLEHELISFLAAGAETSAATMGWACYLLALYPEVQEELRAHCLKFWQSNQQNWATLSSLEPLARFISEALRLFPPTPIVARYALEADQLSDVQLQQGQNVMISFIGIQHDKRLRSDPWSLNMNGCRTEKAAGDTMAFSIGPRICGGKQFALLELITFLGVFLKHARFELSSDDAPEFYWKSQMLRAGGHPVYVKQLT